MQGWFSLDSLALVSLMPPCGCQCERMEGNKSLACFAITECSVVSIPLHSPAASAASGKRARPVSETPNLRGQLEGQQDLTWTDVRFQAHWEAAASQTNLDGALSVFT